MADQGSLEPSTGDQPEQPGEQNDSNSQGSQHTPNSESSLSQKLQALKAEVEHLGQGKQAAPRQFVDDEEKLPDPPEPEFYKGHDYKAFRYFVGRLDNYIEQKPEAFYSEERKIRYAQRRLKGTIAQQWDRHKSTIDLATYKLDDFKSFLLDKVAPVNLREGIRGLIEYSARGDSATQIADKARELQRVTGLNHEEFWANWAIVKAPSPVSQVLGQQGARITTLEDAASRIDMILRAQNNHNEPRPPAVGSKRSPSRRRRPANRTRNNKTRHRQRRTA